MRPAAASATNPTTASRVGVQRVPADTGTARRRGSSAAGLTRRDRGDFFIDAEREEPHLTEGKDEKAVGARG
jgi:hypothetical protein